MHPQVIEWVKLAEIIQSRFSCKEAEESVLRCKYKKPVLGYGFLNPEVMFIGQNPGCKGAQRTGITFYGDRSGNYFTGILNKFFWSRGITFYITNLVKENFNVMRNDILVNEKIIPAKAIRYWLNALVREVRIVKPKRIVALGAVPYRTLMQYRYLFGDIEISRMFHPAFVLRRNTMFWYEEQIREFALKLKSSDSYDFKLFVGKFLVENYSIVQFLMQIGAESIINEYALSSLCGVFK